MKFEEAIFRRIFEGTAMTVDDPLSQVEDMPDFGKMDVVKNAVIESQASKCSRGEHESTLAIKWDLPAGVLECRHCRCLYAGEVK